MLERSGGCAAWIATGNSPEVAELIATALNEATADGQSKRLQAVRSTRILLGDLQQLTAKAERLCDSLEKGAATP